MRVASFFSGIGGFDLGLERAGMEVVFQCEIHPFAQKVLKKHWPTVPLHADIQKLEAEMIPNADLYCGGFPCQDLSLANQGKRKGLEGERSGLFFDFSRLIRARKPRWLIIENVLGLLNSNEGRDFQVVIQTLDEFGYGVAWRVLDTKYFGSPQRRRRVFIVASYQSLRATRVLFESSTPSIPFGTGSESPEAPSSSNGNRYQEPNLYTIQHASIGRKSSAGPQAKGYRNDGETWTLDSRGSADVVCSADAPFGVRESTGLSTGMDSARYRAIGNAVSVPIVEWIGRRILAADKLPEEEMFIPKKPIQLSLF